MKLKELRKLHTTLSAALAQVAAAISKITLGISQETRALVVLKEAGIIRKRRFILNNHECPKEADAIIAIHHRMGLNLEESKELFESLHLI